MNAKDEYVSAWMSEFNLVLESVKINALRQTSAWMQKTNKCMKVEREISGWMREYK